MMRFISMLYIVTFYNSIHYADLCSMSFRSIGSFFPENAVAGSVAASGT